MDYVDMLCRVDDIRLNHWSHTGYDSILLTLKLVMLV